MEDSIYHVQPKLGEGIYLAKDVSKILRLNYEKTYRWMVGYWGSGLDKNTQYTFGEVDNRAINFLSLIEFYTFFKLREKGLSSSQIKKLHSKLSVNLKTRYPFAIAQDIYVEGRKTKKFIYYTHLENLIKLDEKNQFSLKFIEAFLDKIEFNDENLAVKFFPLSNSKNVVVDPKHQFGQPVVNGTNIKTQTLFSLYNGGETLEDISGLYNLSIDKVRDAIAFQKAAYMLFIFDENFPPEFVKGFSILEKANHRSPIKVDVIFSIDFMGENGYSDEEIIEKASDQEAVIITHDSDFKKIKHYKPLLIQHKVGYIYFKVPSGKYHYWDIVKAFVNKWEDIKEGISNSSHPFAFEINKQGHLTKLQF